MRVERVRAVVRGIVQGVGFRPFITEQMTRRGLAGWIRNTSSGAELELEGDRGEIDGFFASLEKNAPPLAVIEGIEIIETGEPAGRKAFEIIESKALDERNTLVSPDVCTCGDCLRELFDEKDRRYRFPFINCTNCGPRFTIIKDVPYDRERTTMAPFPMCGDCAGEYADITDRRYHAQPDCCPVCGPRLAFLDGEGRQVPGEPMQLAREYLKGGKIVAVKGLGGFHLACRADRPALARELRRRKQRDEKPFAVMCRDVGQARGLCEIPPDGQRLLLSPRRPIVLLRKRESNALSHISENDRIGVMLPYTPVHFLLLEGDMPPLVMTSANLSDRPIIFKNDEAAQELSGVADGFLVHNREIFARCDDSVLWCVGGREYFARRSRGYVPLPLTVKNGGGDILACGAEQKATFSLLKGEHVFPSQHIGDLKNAETLDVFIGQIERFERLFGIRPEKIVCDLHPDYLSSVYARERAAREGLPLVAVQHHFAHMLSCMADNGLDGECIGIIWDGTGLGDDGTAWGGEFLTGGYSGYKRRGSLRPFPLCGGDAAVKQIWRLACALCLDAGADYPDRQRLDTVRRLISLNVNCPAASSVGRLFDAMSALAGIKDTVSYEGQGAILLEAAAAKSEKSLSYNIYEENGLYLFDHRPMFAEAAQILSKGVGAGETAARFMNAMCRMAIEMCRKIREDTGLSRVVLSGGVFQNMYLIERLPAMLRDAGFEAYIHRRVSTNDEGLSLGQIFAAKEGGGVDVPRGSL